MAIGFSTYVSYTYLDYDSASIKVKYPKPSEVRRYAFGTQPQIYTSTGYTDNPPFFHFNILSFLYDYVFLQFDRRNRLWESHRYGADDINKRYVTEVNIFPKCLNTMTGARIKMNVTINCFAYGEDKKTRVKYGSSEHKYTQVMPNATVALMFNNTSYLSTNLDIYTDGEENFIEGKFDPDVDPQSTLLLCNLYSHTINNITIHPTITGNDIYNLESVTNYINSVDNMCVFRSRTTYSDNRSFCMYLINVNNNIKNWLNGWLTSTDFYNSDDVIGHFDDDDNGGNHDDTSDYIPIGELPSINIFASGLISGYNIDTANLSQLGNFLWDDNFVESLPKLVANPMDAIICLKSFPFDLTQFGSSSTVKIGGIDTEISATKINRQYAVIDCGILNVREYYGDFTDYDNTTVLINLPYIGEHILPTDEVLESTLHLYYKVDLLSGACMAQIMINKSKFGTDLAGSIYNFKGNIASEYPLTGQMYGNILNALNGLFTTNFAMAINSANSIVNGERKIEINGNHSENYGALGIQTPFLKIVSPIQNNPNSFNRDLGAYANQTATIGNLKGYTEIDAINLRISDATDAELQEIKTALYNGVVIY